MPKITSF